jgi:hypothetical protein
MMIEPSRNAQIFPDDKQVHREPTLSRLSVDASDLLKVSCMLWPAASHTFVQGKARRLKFEEKIKCS